MIFIFTLFELSGFSKLETLMVPTQKMNGATNKFYYRYNLHFYIIWVEWFVKVRNTDGTNAKDERCQYIFHRDINQRCW
jgi:hypothetical protein